MNYEPPTDMMAAYDRMLPENKHHVMHCLKCILKARGKMRLETSPGAKLHMLEEVANMFANNGCEIEDLG